MKQISFLIVVIVILVSCKKNENASLKNEWVSTYTGIFSRAGVFLDLSDRDSLLFSQIDNPQSRTSYKYKLDSFNNLILNDTINFGQLVKQTRNVIIIKDTVWNYTFFRIKDFHLKSDSATIRKILLSNDWEFNDQLGTYRLEFSNNPWFVGNGLKSVLKINESKGFESVDSEWWTIAVYKKSFFIILSTRQFDFQVYQIKSISDSIISAETIWSDSIKDVKFFAYKKLHIKKYNKLQDKLIGKWQLIEYQESGNSSFEDEILITRKGRTRPFNRKDSVPAILDTYYKNKKINYIFSQDSKCSMNTGDFTLRESNWKFSQDGKYIQIEDGWMHSMKIISISDSTLVTEKHETIEYEEIGIKGRNDWDDKYIQETFRKVK